MKSKKDKVNNNIHLNYINLIGDKNINNISIEETCDNGKVHNSTIHENYVKLTNGQNVNNSISYQDTKNTKLLHNNSIHDNYIKLMNSGYKTRIIKSADELRYDDLYDDNIQR